MARKSSDRPTDAELAILRVLWDQGPSTVREVHDSLGEARDTGYTTILKQLLIMAEKGLVARDERDRAHVYRARWSEARTQKHILAGLLDRLFAGSTAKLVQQALEGRKSSRKELAEIRRLLDQLEEDSK